MNPFDEGPPGPFFVGREHELAQLDEGLASVGTGVSSGVLVAGLHGSGKSSVLEECVRRCDSAQLLAVETSVASTATAHEQLRTMIEDLVHRFDELHPADHLLAEHWRGKVPDYRLREPLLQFGDSDFLNTAALKHDFGLILKKLDAAGVRGIVFVLDEAQDLGPQVFAAFRQLGRWFKGLLFVVAVRVPVASDGAEQAGRQWMRMKITRPAADPGIERFFPLVIPMGPFSEEDAEECIRRRLEETDISFQSDLITAITVLGDRVPREIMRLSRSIYDTCSKKKSRRATLAMLEPAYKSAYGAEISVATERINPLGEREQRYLKALAVSQTPLTAEDIARRCHPTAFAEGATDDEREHAMDSVIDGLATIQQNCRSMSQGDDGYFAIDSEVNRAAIRVALRLSAV